MLLQDGQDVAVKCGRGRAAGLSADAKRYTDEQSRDE